jgi:hypothetical protein
VLNLRWNRKEASVAETLFNKVMAEAWIVDDAQIELPKGGDAIATFGYVYERANNVPEDSVRVEVACLGKRALALVLLSETCDGCNDLGGKHCETHRGAWGAVLEEANRLRVSGDVVTAK